MAMDIFTTPFVVSLCTFVACVCLFVLVIAQNLELEKAARRRERKLDAVISHLGIDLDAIRDLPPVILEHLKAGRKLEARKAYRSHTGAGFLEAKEIIEEMIVVRAAK